MTIRQARKFFATILDLDYKRKAHRHTFLWILKIIDPEQSKLVLKERIIDFFELSAFLSIQKLEEEQRNMGSDSDEEETSSLLESKSFSLEDENGNKSKSATHKSTESQHSAQFVFEERPA